jgi:hypothetical protein
MAAEAALSWDPDRLESPEYTVASCPEDDQAFSPGRLLAAAAVAVTACLLVAAPAMVGLASMVDADAVTGALARTQGIPEALSGMAAWRVPAAIVLVVGLAVARRYR